MYSKKKIGLIGTGALSKIFTNIFNDKLSQDYELLGTLSRDQEKNKIFASENKCTAYNNISEMILDKPDYVIEIASKSAVEDYGELVLEAGINLIIISVGALADEILRRNLENLAKEKGVKIYIAPGAIGGFDLLQTISMMEESDVAIRTYKAPKSLEGAPYLKEKILDREKDKLVFTGNASEAISAFPKNINVAVAASIASIGTENSLVELYSIPQKEGNTHKINIYNELASANIEINSLPDKKNPKSSVITAWSIASLLKNLASPIEFF